MRTSWRLLLVAKYDWSEFASDDPRDEVFIIIICQNVHSFTEKQHMRGWD